MRKGVADETASMPRLHHTWEDQRSFNIGIGIAGGTAPILATTLIGTTGDLMAPAWFLMLGAALAASAAFLMKDWSRDPLR
jgi:MHS family proline/betaine transporter-like MFS transporter